MKRFVFQCNANEATGLGHLSRCLSIALALKSMQKCQLIFVGHYHDFATMLLIDNDVVIANKSTFILQRSDQLILDDYQVHQADIDQLRAQVDTFIKIDDFHQHDLSDLDLIINFRLNAEKEDYSSNYRAKNTCLGLSYFPFQQQLLTIRAKNTNKKITYDENIFIFIGGNDEGDAGIKLLQMIDSLVTKKNLYLISKDTPSLPIGSATKQNLWHYLPLSAKMSDYYQQADIFISGGGLSKYEAAFCLIANASISQNEGQALDTKVLSKANLTFDLGLTEDLVLQPQKTIQRLMEFLTQTCQKKIINNAKIKFNSNSTQAVASAIDRL